MKNNIQKTINITVVICCNDTNWVSKLTDELKVPKDYVQVQKTVVVHTGNELLKAIQKVKANVVISDYIIPEMNLPDVLEKLRIKPSYTIALLDTYVKSMVVDAGRAGASQFFINVDPMIVVNSIIRHYDRMVVGKDIYAHSLEKSVYNVLNGLGVPHGLYGYLYIRDAVLWVYRDPTYLYNVTGKLYPDLAIKYTSILKRPVNPAMVERAIREAKNIAWARGSIDIITDVFGFSYNPDKGTPTNSEYFGGIVDYLRLQRGFWNN